jgi:hypothetical protein
VNVNLTDEPAGTFSGLSRGKYRIRISLKLIEEPVSVSVLNDKPAAETVTGDEKPTEVM